MPTSAWDCVGATGNPVSTPPPPIRALGELGTREDPRPVNAIGTDALDDDGTLAGARPTKGIDAFTSVGPRPLGAVGTSPLGAVGTSPLGSASAPPSEELPLTLAKAVVTVDAVSRLFGVGTCSPASAVAVLNGAADIGWSPIRAALAATTVPVAIAAVRIRSWAGEDFRACFDMGGPFREKERLLVRGMFAKT
ncbi:hypothetical protein [Mycobacterium sp.]|uniref:hypothetical protein n=1 Tax=Mycobacterium sp. TaxID=1785 RepID=UPI002DA5072A|nr:hypothetical protein [Mycobacterium sp.]